MSSKIANQMQTFYSSVCKTPFCWNWTGPVDDEGYAWTDIPRRPRRAVTFLYETMHGPIPISKRIGLTCYNRLCVNQDHIAVWDRQVPLVVTDEERRATSLERCSFDPVVRFWSWVNKDGPVPSWKPELGPCWQWLGAPSSKGYASTVINNQSILVHRYSYLLVHDSIPDELELDHLCRNRLCVNPKHLEAVTHAENMQRASGYRLSQTTCKHGHEYTEENTHYRYDKNHNRWWRSCRKCERKYKRSSEWWHEYYKKLFKDEGGLLVQYE